MQALRIGKGFDIHKLTQGPALLVGGIEIPFDKGCLAHSDGDVLLHAVIDSLLGAAGYGDIGTHFPDSDPQYKGISSIELFKKIRAVIPSFSCINIDMTVFAEEPRLSPFRKDIEQSVADLLSIETERVNFKAKTMETLGEIGSGNAIAAEAVVLLYLN